MTLTTAYNILRLGWDRLQDDEFTSVSPKALLADVLTNIPINVATEEGSGSRVVWVPASSRLFPLDGQDFYWAVVTLTVISPIGTGNFIEVSLDTSENGDATTIDEGLIYCESKPVLFPSGIPQCLTFNMGVPAEEKFVTNGGLLRVRSPKDVDTFNYSLTANKTFNE